jgi:hypothetical protein
MLLAHARSRDQPFVGVGPGTESSARTMRIAWSQIGFEEIA